MRCYDDIESMEELKQGNDACAKVGVVKNSDHTHLNLFMKVNSYSQGVNKDWSMVSIFKTISMTYIRINEISYMCDQVFHALFIWYKILN